LIWLFSVFLNTNDALYNLYIIKEMKMALWTLLVWLGIGALAGMLAGKLMGGTTPFGLVGDIILGIVGGVLGGYILALLGFSGSGGIIGSFVVAVLGAMLLLWSARKIKG
jgi:uncharacterized membrane protein YeaQ/YmgE (transglycosylase-associated protein family)